MRTPEDQSIRPSWPEGYLLKAELAEKRDRPEEAVEAYQQAITLGTKQTVANVKANQLKNVVVSPSSEFENPAYYGLPSTVRAPKELVFKTPDPGTYIISANNIAWMKTVDAAWRRYEPVDRIGGMWVYRF